ncbi:hypothetical protein, partial [Pseudomonas aeruginosa]|uniref:hypothetical protein n=1 Tax=Pseudomonas aeruginosa TaxID=287 RepID=UPI0036EC3CA7
DKKRDDQASRKDATSIPADGVKEILDGWQRTQDELDQALQRIAELEAQLASRITEKKEPEAKTWAIQERKGKARWQTISKGLTRKAGERQFDKLLSGLSDPRYTYRMVEE